MAITYLKAGTKNKFASTVLGLGFGTVKLGRIDTGGKLKSTTKVMGVGLKLGSKDQTSVSVGSVSDRPPNPITGFTAAKIPTYGANPSALVWAEDRSRGAKAKYTYFTPLKPSGKLFKDLK